MTIEPAKAYLALARIIERIYKSPKISMNKGLALR